MVGYVIANVKSLREETAVGDTVFGLDLGILEPIDEGEGEGEGEGKEEDDKRCDEAMSLTSNKQPGWLHSSAGALEAAYTRSPLLLGENLSAKQMVYASIFAGDGGDFSALALAVDRLVLNDAAVSVAKEQSRFGLSASSHLISSHLISSHLNQSINQSMIQLKTR